MREKIYKKITCTVCEVLIGFTLFFLSAIYHPALADEYRESLVTPVPSPVAADLSVAPDTSAGKGALHIPIILNTSVEAYIEFFRNQKTTFQQGLNNSIAYLHMMKKIFRNENLPEELVYVVMIESWFNPVAISHASAVGPWQFMMVTAREYGLRNNQWIDERRDVIKSTRAAARYLRNLHSRLGSWPLVLAAYNAGLGTVRNAISGTGSEDFWDLKESDYLTEETKSFVPKIMAAAIIARDPAAYGFRVPPPGAQKFDVVEVPKSTDLHTVAKDINSSYTRIRSLNPEIKGKFTPPGRYFLKIPEGKKKIFLAKRDEAKTAAVELARKSPAKTKDIRVLLSESGRPAKSRKS